MGARHRRKGSLCSDGQNCIYAELLDLEERRIAELEEKAEDLEEKLARSVEELSLVKQSHAIYRVFFLTRPPLKSLSVGR